MTDTAGCTCDLSELGMVVWTAPGCPVHDCRPRVPYALDKDDPQVVEKAQANMDAAAAHYAERERVLRGRKGGHSWASLPTFPLSSTFAADLMADRMCRKYGGAEHVPSEYRTAIQLIYDALVSADA